MHNKDRLVLSRFADAFAEYAKEDKSKAAKELRDEREAWEKAAGGAKRLADAHILAQTILDVAHSDADKISDDAVMVQKTNASLNLARIAKSNETDDRLNAREIKLIDLGASLDARREETDAASRELQAREILAVELAADLAKRETAVTARETAVTAESAALESRLAYYKAGPD